MKAPQEILDLVARFDQNFEAYQSGLYKETQLRQEFINPFFKALGWDIDNTSGYAEAYKDVIHEDAIKIGSANKAPDYSFRTGGTRKFFVEAKKPSVNIAEDIGPAYQLRRYAWSAKLPLSILTDFEEFAVYDCRVKPDKSDKATTARIMYLNCKDYLTRWKEIADVFSKDAVMKGSFDKYAESAKVKKGTAGVDAAFLSEIDSWRQALAQNIALRNSKLSQRELNYSVGKTIDRIIFLRICEDRGIEPYGQLLALQNGVNIYQRLIEIYYSADDKYNSGLFHFKQEKERSAPPDDLTLTLSVDDRIFKDIFKSLYYPESPYEFSVLPADILGQVYEQFLGKVIHLTPGHRAKVEEKPEVRKAGGVYYTPTYIVDYIVKNTVGKLLDGKTPKTAQSLRILDPACGSGSFLIGAYQYLLDWHRDKYVDDDPEKYAKGKNPALYQKIRNEWRLTTAERKRILLNNIYGVDIDPQAVEVTKLSLLLKVLEGESDQTIKSSFKLFHERALPDLGNNIKCGNSLIGPDYYEGKQTSFLDTEEMQRVNAFDWEKEFPEIFKAGGFDAVIGNPPYVLVDKDEEKEKNYLQNYYRLSIGKPDLYKYFIERSHQLLKNNGLFGFIIPNTLLTIPSSKDLRKYLLKEGGLRKIINFWGQIFHKVSVNSIIIFTEKMSANKEVEIIEDKSITPDAKTLIEAEKNKYFIERNIWIKDEEFKFSLSFSSNVLQIIEKIKNLSDKLSTVCKYTLGMQVYHNSMHTEEQIKKRIYHSKNKENNTYFRESGGENVKRYLFVEKFKNYVSYGNWCYNKPEKEFCSGERILIREIPSKTLVCTITDTIHIPTKAVIIIIPEKVNVNYLLGILNSLLIGFYIRATGEKSFQRLFPRISLTTTRNLPIRIINFSIPRENRLHDNIVQLVDQMIELNKQLQKAKTDHEKTLVQRQIETTDKQIDKLVYELYDLTEEEIKIVEGP